MRVTVLIENTSQSALVCEHGLSLFIETGGKKILLDAGSTEAFVGNAEALGINLKDIDIAVLSHGHYDHSGGFAAFFEKNVHAPFYVRRGADNAYYFLGKDKMRYIGVPENVLEGKERFTFIDKDIEIMPGVWLVAHSTPGLSAIGEKTRLYKKEGERMLPDDFAHEQSLVADTPKGLVIFNSCSHGGVANIIREARERCGGRDVYAYVGGLHMVGKKHGVETCIFSDDEVESLCCDIKDAGLTKIYTGHCTGAPALEKLRARLGDAVVPITTGMSVEI